MSTKFVDYYFSLPPQNIVSIPFIMNFGNCNACKYWTIPAHLKMTWQNRYADAGISTGIAHFKRYSSVMQYFKLSRN